MLSLKSARIVCSSRALLHPDWLTTGRQCVYKAVTCSAQCMSTSFPRKDTWHSNTNVKALGKQRKLIYCTNPVSSPRSYCTGQVKLNWWNCNQPLEKTPGFFCMSCKLVQPPQEGASFFKIMDWWVSFIHCLTHERFIHSFIYSVSKTFHVTMCWLFSVTTHSHWTHKSCRKDTCSSSGLCIQTTSARNLW